MTYDDDEFLLNHHDACIYGRDLKLLEDPYHAWLNDACLHYQFVCLSRSFDDDSILFWDPSVVFCFLMLLDDKDEFADFVRGYPTLMKTTCRKLFLPINDTLSHETILLQQPSRNQTLGTHWSLLLITFTNTDEGNCDIMYRHYDSSSSRHGGGNSTAAHRVAEQFQSFWHHLNDSSTTNNKNPIHVQEMKTPQQTNGYHCGCHVLLTAQILAETEEEDEWEEQLQRRITPQACIELLQAMARDIRARMKNNAI
jgi:hypothetical protein